MRIINIIFFYLIIFNMGFAKDLSVIKYYKNFQGDVLIFINDNNISMFGIIGSYNGQGANCNFQGETKDNISYIWNLEEEQKHFVKTLYHESDNCIILNFKSSKIGCSFYTEIQNKLCESKKNWNLNDLIYAQREFSMNKNKFETYLKYIPINKLNEKTKELIYKSSKSIFPKKQPLYKKPNIKTKMYLIKGDKVEVLEEKDDWLYILYHGKKDIKAWIPKNSVE